MKIITNSRREINNKSFANFIQSHEETSEYLVSNEIHSSAKLYLLLRRLDWAGRVFPYTILLKSRDRSHLGIRKASIVANGREKRNVNNCETGKPGHFQSNMKIP